MEWIDAQRNGCLIDDRRQVNSAKTKWSTTFTAQIGTFTLPHRMLPTFHTIRSCRCCLDTISLHSHKVHQYSFSFSLWPISGHPLVPLSSVLAMTHISSISSHTNVRRVYISTSAQIHFQIHLTARTSIWICLHSATFQLFSLQQHSLSVACGPWSLLSRLCKNLVFPAICSLMRLNKSSWFTHQEWPVWESWLESSMRGKCIARLTFYFSPWVGPDLLMDWYVSKKERQGEQCFELLVELLSLVWEDGVSLEDECWMAVMNGQWFEYECDKMKKNAPVLSKEEIRR